MNYERWSGKSLDFLQSQNFAPRGDGVLVAVSGGLDSMCLLHYWAETAGPLFDTRLAVVHVHHGLRADADADFETVQRVSLRRGVPFFHKQLKPETRNPKLSVEMWAREERYAFFQEVLSAHLYDWVLTAHHLDDQVETLLMRLGRGTGLKGLRGVLFRRGPVIRPFLNRSKSELREYARHFAVEWREDESNENKQYERNWFRKVYVPAQFKLDSRLPERALNISMNVQELWAQIEKELAEQILFRDGHYFLNAPSYKSTLSGSEELGFLLLNELGQKYGLRISEWVFEEFNRQLSGRARRPGICLNSDWVLACDDREIWFRRVQNGTKERKKPSFRFNLSGEFGEQQFHWTWFGRRYTLYKKNYTKNNDFNLKRDKGNKVQLDAAKVNGSIVIRTRHPGDRFSPLGASGCRRRLKGYFNGIKLPVKSRDEQMIVWSGGRVAWLPGLEISEECKIRSETSEILELEIQCQR